LKTALVGYGYWGRNVLEALVSNDFLTLDAIYDSDKSQINAALSILESKHNQFLCKAYNSFEENLDDKSIVAIMIITPPQTHFVLAKKALESKKHVFVEKPLATSLKECEELFRIAESNGRILHCDHIFLYSPAVNYLKRHIAEFGEIVYVLARRVNLGLFQSNVDVIWDLAIHDLSILDYLFCLDMKNIANLHRFISKYRGFDALGDIYFELKKSNSKHIAVHINVSWLSPIKAREMIIGGERKTAIYDETKENKISVFDCGIVVDKKLEKQQLYKQMISYHLGEVAYPALDSSLGLDNSIKAFINQIRLGRIDMDLKAHILRVMNVLEAISSAP